MAISYDTIYNPRMTTYTNPGIRLSRQMMPNAPWWFSTRLILDHCPVFPILEAYLARVQLYPLSLVIAGYGQNTPRRNTVNTGLSWFDSLASQPSAVTHGSLMHMPSWDIIATISCAVCPWPSISPFNCVVSMMINNEKDLVVDRHKKRLDGNLCFDYVHVFPIRISALSCFPALTARDRPQFP